jgi:hypothetical protein
MDSELAGKCCALAQVAAQIYRAENPDRDIVVIRTRAWEVDLDSIWGRVWQTLEACGATPNQKIECREQFSAMFFDELAD